MTKNSMWYRSVVLLFCAVSLPLPRVEAAPACVSEDGLKGVGKREPVIALRAPTEDESGAERSAAEEEDPATEREQSRSEGEGEAARPQPAEKTRQLKEFSPSEKIEADKAVDLPVDI
jgi:hypothetical protein